MSIEGVSFNSVISNSIDVSEKQQASKDQLETKEPTQEDNNIKFTKEKLEKVVQGMNDFLTPTTTSLKFELHDELNKYYVKVVDANTQEVIREIPSKKLLDIYASMTEFLGLAVDKKV
ncbi:flagellar protein FlaG [Metabacillus litoralis]|uniref:flagellar protein FlaG n=1 Tax=Metabacillus litoralis TaxID=152268 RepID=UPI00203ECE0C|nr:flagellar protein FlaG [Metabacillus litoralis]MCM3162331.1 flagellar protein FlaG [Metabacillus litoralis]